MSINCNSKNPLQRDGTSQAQRELNTLLPGYVAVDERSLDDLRLFAVQYAKEIKFFSKENVDDGNWGDFFDRKLDSNSKYNAPHYVLFFAFLKLFKYAQDELNLLTKKHLDFYYRDVLHLKEKAAVPAQVYLIFDLAKHVSLHLIEKETRFKAGKDDLGNKVIYKLEEEATISKAVVSELKAVFYNNDNIYSDLVPNPRNDARLYVSPLAKSEDGEGAELTSEDKSWRTFGGIQFPDINSGGEHATVADRKQAEIGFAFASPNLFLAEGERIVTIYLNLSSPKLLLNDLTDELLYDAFQLKFSGEEEWIEPLWDTKYGRTSGEERILDFLNHAKTAEDIAGIEPAEGPVYDDPTKGYGDQSRDYDIGLRVAGNILEARDKLPSKQFTSLDQVRSVAYVGKDKIDDLLYSFGERLHSTQVDREHNRLIIKRTITRDQASIVAYNQGVLLDPFETKWPVVKILLNTNGRSNPFLYKKLQSLEISSVDIVVDVKEVKNLILQNDNSVLDPAKPFQPFGNRPIVGSNFYIGSWEVFQKSLNGLRVNIKWFGLPEDPKGFEGYYKYYYPNSPRRNNISFKVKSSLLDKKSWKTIDADRDALFSGVFGKLPAASCITFSNPEPLGEPSEYVLGEVDRDEKLKHFDRYDQNGKKGFVRLSLSGTDFGHREYQTSYTKAVLKAMNPPEGPPNLDYTDQLPNEPYTPEIESISLDYMSSVRIDTLDVSVEDYENRVEQFFHVHPMGVCEIETTSLGKDKEKDYLLPQYNNEGELYIGIKDLQPPQNLSVLFQVSEGTSDPDLIPPKIKWFYLSKNKWIPFHDQDILSDSTKGLITTGVVQFAIPSSASDDNTILTNGLFWIKASAEKNSNGIPQLIEVKCQAAKVVFEDQNNDRDYLRKPMAEKTITKMVDADSAIKKVEQPFTSFGGKVKEGSDAFYTRVSERLRHKNRAITIWDYERILLHYFPEIYKVKCMNHTRFKGTPRSINEAAPGHVSLIIVSNIRNKNAVAPLKPRTSLVTLRNIEEFIGTISSPYIKIHVHNPLFEEVRVKFHVRFHPGYDKGIYLARLQEAVIRYLSPWAFESGSDIVFGGTIHKSVILNFVEQQSYVDFITCFEMFHIVPDDPSHDPDRDVDEVVVSTSASILGSAASHNITVFEPGNENVCLENEIKTIEIASADDCPCE